MDSCNGIPGIPGIPANIEHVLDRPKYVENHPLNHGFWVVFRMNRKGFTGIALTSRRWLGKLQVQAYPGDDTHQRELVHRWSRHCKCRADVPLHKSRSQDKWPPSARVSRPDSDRTRDFEHWNLTVHYPYHLFGVLYTKLTHIQTEAHPHISIVCLHFGSFTQFVCPSLKPAKHWTEQFSMRQIDLIEIDGGGVLVVCVTIYIYIHIYTHI
jgi:hypothetical protein